MTPGGGRSLIERLGLDPGVVPGSDALVRRPHVWVGGGTEMRRPGVAIRQARSVEGGWLVQVSWVEADPQRPGEAEHRVAWLPADQVSSA